jgi:hypothetical protein
LERAKEVLRALIHELSEAGLHNAAKYLPGAARYAFLYREVPDSTFYESAADQPYAIMATSPVQRQIDKINRRTDVGVQ